MTAYLIRRAFQMSLVVMLATFAIYVLLNVAPGGPLSGLQLSADRRTRVSEADIARLEAYLGLDKPMILRYLTWLVGDDWLGADWVYVSLSQYSELDTGKDGTPLVKTDRKTGEQYYTFTNHRFWANPGVAHLNPGYLLWIWGEEIAPREFQATEIQVKPPANAQTPQDVVAAGFVDSQNRFTVIVKDFNDTAYTIQTNDSTVWNFPPGEAEPRPEEGR